MVRRFQALLLVLALLASPLALYARGAANEMSDCGGMCCLPHGHHAPQRAQQNQAAATPAKDADCHHDDAGAEVNASDAHKSQLSCALECAMHSSPHASSYGLLTTMAPTKPSEVAVLRVAQKSHAASFQVEQTVRSGFLASPFQPPRA
jgi:hypothetical protein